jgi:nucleoside-diphosphate-sugar epimerase
MYKISYSIFYTPPHHLGTNVWSHIHIDDQVDLFILVLRKALQERADGAFPKDPYERFYWGASRTHVWGDIARALAAVMYQAKLVDSPEATSVSLEDMDLLRTYTSANSLVVANRAFKDGWKPKRGPIEEYLSEDLEETLKNE